MTTIDCQTCPVRDRHCGDCFVPVLGRLWLEDELSRPAADGSVPLDDAEQSAVQAFVRSGLVSPDEAWGLRATRTTAWGAVG